MRAARLSIRAKTSGYECSGRAAKEVKAALVGGLFIWNVSPWHEAQVHQVFPEMGVDRLWHQPAGHCGPCPETDLGMSR